jgi:DNA-3-methyladenine glycosylase II
MKAQGTDDREREALAHLKRMTPRLHQEALAHKGQVLSRVQPKRTRQALFIALCTSIVNQQLSTKAAQSIFNRLREKLGSITPEALLKASPASLRSAGLSQAKVKSLKGLAAAVKDGSIDLLALKSAAPESAVLELTQLHGIGPWTAEMFLIFALGAPDVFSPGDLILERQARRILQLPDTVTKKELGELARQWSPHRSYVSLLFWRLHHAQQEDGRS